MVRKQIKNMFLNPKKFCIKSFNTINRLLLLFDCFVKYTKPTGPYTKFISLGQNCIPRTFFTNWGIKPTKAMGELSMPFDLMYGTNKNIIVNIFNNFRCFFEELCFNDDEKMFSHTDGRAHYNHDIDLCNDAKKFKERYKNRINNFMNAINTKENILFIYNDCYYGKSKEKYINCLFRLLKLKRKGLPFGLLVFDLECDKKLDCKKINKEIVVIREPFPYKEYIWYKEEHCNSKEGIEFMTKLKNKVIEYLDSCKNSNK